MGKTLTKKNTSVGDKKGHLSSCLVKD